MTGVAAQETASGEASHIWTSPEIDQLFDRMEKAYNYCVGAWLVIGAHKRDCIIEASACRNRFFDRYDHQELADCDFWLTEAGF